MSNVSAFMCVHLVQRTNGNRSKYHKVVKEDLRQTNNDDRVGFGIWCRDVTLPSFPQRNILSVLAHFLKSCGNILTDSQPNESFQLDLCSQYCKQMIFVYVITAQSPNCLEPVGQWRYWHHRFGICCANERSGDWKEIGRRKVWEMSSHL